MGFEGLGAFGSRARARLERLREIEVKVKGSQDLELYRFR